MLIAKPTPNGAGIALFGDAMDLESLHVLVHRLAGGSPLFESPLSDFLLGLAYDVRHARQRDRLEETFGEDDFDQVTYRGVEILWPYMLVQLALMRSAAAYHPTSRLDQALLFMLEHCVEDALTSHDAVIGQKVFELRHVVTIMNPSYYVQFINKMAHEFACEGKARFKRLPELMLRLSPLSDEYRAFALSLEREAKRQGVNPHELEDQSEWPDFEW